MKEKSGFTLIEVMIALAVLMIGLIGIIGVQVAGIHQLAQAKQRTIATQLGVQVLEHLKNVPVDNGNPEAEPAPIPPDPSRIFTDALGKALVDADGQALMYDANVGDGYLTWHRLGLMSADGRILPPGGRWDAEYFYLAIYGVEWGGWNGSQEISAEGSKDELVLAQYPDMVPGPNQIYIEVWVGWVDPGQKAQEYSGTTLKQIVDYFNTIIDPGSPGAPKVNFKRKVVLKTLRMI